MITQMHTTVTGRTRNAFLHALPGRTPTISTGLSAECGLKAVLESEGQIIDPLYKHHVDRLWPAFVSFAQGRTGATHLSMLPPATPFHDWRVGQRYAHHGNFGQAYVEPHRDAARAVRAMFQLATQGGRP